MLFQNFDISSIYKVMHLPGLTAALPDNKVEIVISVQLQAPLCVSVLDRSVLGINTEHIKALPLPLPLI